MQNNIVKPGLAHARAIEQVRQTGGVGDAGAYLAVDDIIDRHGAAFGFRSKWTSARLLERPTELARAKPDANGRRTAPHPVGSGGRARRRGGAYAAVWRPAPRWFRAWNLEAGAREMVGRGLWARAACWDTISDLGGGLG